MALIPIRSGGYDMCERRMNHAAIGIADCGYPRRSGCRGSGEDEGNGLVHERGGTVS
jgi:hypothetical protein